MFSFSKWQRNLIDKTIASFLQMDSISRAAAVLSLSVYEQTQLAGLLERVITESDSINRRQQRELEIEQEKERERAAAAERRRLLRERRKEGNACDKRENTSENESDG